MDAILTALLTVFGIMGFGFFTERRRLFPQAMALCLNQFVYWVSLPCLLFAQMSSIPMDGNARALVTGGFTASMLGYVFFYALFSFGFRRNGPEATVRALGSSFANAAFFGLPFIMLVFPDSVEAVNACMITALIFTGVSITADVSLETLRANRSGSQSMGATFRRIPRELAKNPMLQATALALALRAADITPPEAVMRFTSLLGSTCAPCALFSMGMVLSAQMAALLSPETLRRSLRPVAAVSASKLLLCPLISYLGLRIAGCSGVMLAAGTMTFAMPVAVMVYILAERYESCAAEASLTVIVSTLLSILSLPLVMFLLTAVGW